MVKSIPVGLGAGYGTRRVLGHRMVPEEQVATHSLHRGIAQDVRGVLEVRVHRGADEVGDVRAHTTLRHEVVDANTSLLHQLSFMSHTTRDASRNEWFQSVSSTLQADMAYCLTVSGKGRIWFVELTPHSFFLQLVLHENREKPRLLSGVGNRKRHEQTPS